MGKLIVANWKMSLTFQEAENFCIKLAQQEVTLEMIIAPPSLYLSALSQEFAFKWAGQNITALSASYGAFTGEVSARMLRNLNVGYVILGHSERRKYFHETNSEIKQKAENAIAEGITPIICIGESLDVREEGKWQDVLAEQVKSCVPLTDKQIIIAYEPIWAIGTGKSASKEMITETAQLIKPYISKVAKNYSLVYGGSVNSENIHLLSTINEIDGLLIGSSSLNFDEFMKIVKAYA